MAISNPVVTLILSLQHELTSKGIRVQVVLPGRTATDGWDVAGYSSRCADVFTLYFPNKTRRICSGSSSYNVDPVLGPEGVAQNIPGGRDDFSSLLRECSSRFSKRRPALALVGIRRAVN